MRRPLLQPDGTPFFQAAAGSATLFDASDLDPTYTWAVTLYAWYPQGDVTNIGVGIQTPGEVVPVVPTGIWLALGDPIDAFRVNGIGPAKVMDRVVIRGNQQVVVVSVGAYDTAGVTWFGYVERAGVAPMPQTYNPLLRGPLVSDFPGIPNLIVVPANASPPTVTETVHMLDGSEERRMDLLDLYVSCIIDDLPGSSPTCNLLAPGGVVIPIPVLDSTVSGPAGSPIHFYDRIPVRAPTQNDNLFQLQVTGDDAETVTAVAYGRYCRS